MPKRRAFKPNQLRKIADAASFRGPEEGKLVIGNTVMINSGGPRMMIVADHDRETVTAAWRDGKKTVEHEFVRAVLHRVQLP